MEIALFLWGFAMWYATGIDDALIFGGIISGTRNPLERLSATLGLIVAFAIMVGIVALSGGVLTAFLQREVFGFQAQGIILIGAFLLVVCLGYNAWPKDSTSGDDDSQPIPSSPIKVCLAAMSGFLINCTDDIVVNSANIIGKTNSQGLAYMSGVTFGVLSMIAITWLAHSKLVHYSEKYAVPFDRARAIGMWIAALLIIWPLIG